MRVLTAGGGSGGHVTPVLAVLDELNRQSTEKLEARFVCERSFGSQSRSLMSRASLPVKVHVIMAGKIRRYSGVSWWRQLLDIGTVLLNIRDVVFLSIGIIQSVALMLVWRPDVVFTKGGFVCVPVGIAARLLRVPIVMHDSDTHPGLANRLLSRWASHIATGSPLKYYPYPADRSRYTGIPIDPSFHPFDADNKRAVRQRLGFTDANRPLLVVTGGGLGARKINDAILESAERLVDQYGVSIMHVTGSGDYERCRQLAFESPHYRLEAFVSTGMVDILGAADVVVTRAGATVMQELAALRSCAIVIPHPYLTGGHQLKNAEVFSDVEAAVVIFESQLAEDHDILSSTIFDLIKNDDRRFQLASNLAQFAKPQAAADVAEMILKAAK